MGILFVRFGIEDLESMKVKLKDLFRLSLIGVVIFCCCVLCECVNYIVVVCFVDVMK